MSALRLPYDYVSPAMSSSDRRTESVAKFKVCEYSFITLSGLNLVLDVIPYALWLIGCHAYNNIAIYGNVCLGLSLALA